MRKILRYFHRNIFHRYLVSSVLIMILQIADVHSSCAKYSVVVISMMAQNSAVYWPRGESRIDDELRMSRLNVIFIVGTPYASLDIKDELMRIGSPCSECGDSII